MKHKNTLLLLLLIFSAICAYNIYWSFDRIKQDSELSEMTPEQRSDWLKDSDNIDHYKRAVSNSMSLGLDLQGGMFITMEVGVDDVIKGLADNPQDPTFQKAMAMAREKAKTSQSDFVDLFVASLREVDPKVKLATYFGGSNTRLTFTASDDEVIKKLKIEANDAIDRTFNIIRTRIDQFGVASPNLQKQPGTGRILIELPGVKDATRVRKLLRGTARLEFWPTYTVQEAFPYVERINEKVRQIKGLSDTTKAADKKLADAKKGKDGKDVKAADTTKKSLEEALGNNVPKTKADSARKDSLSKDEQRVKFERENPFYAALRFPDFNNMSPTSPVVGYCLPTDTSKVNAYLNMPQVRQIIPNDMKLLWTAKPDNESSQYLTLVAIKSNRENRAPLTGEVIVDTKQDYDQDGKSPVVNMSMNTDGAKIWKKMTTDYLNKSIAVVLDNMVYTYPNVNSVIANGSSVIQGNFTLEEAKDLANILKAGKLPAPARIGSDEVIGPTLGADTISKGLVSFIFGFMAVIAFMLVYYRGSGAVASVALLFNLFLVLGISSAFQVVLTLPGIAGIVLSMAMAVDANVLIYERIREELEQGRSFKSAITAGFRNALSAIIDGNITIFLTGVILYVFGSGPIRGFAVTLMIGIVTTMVAALLVTRVILEFMAGRNEKSPIQFGIPTVAAFFRSVHVEIIARRKFYYVIIAALVALCFAGVFGLGFKTGVDFRGGRQYVVEFNQTPADNVTEEVRQDLTQAFGGNQPIIKTVGAKNQLMVTTAYLIDDSEAEEKVGKALIDGLNQRHAELKPAVIKSTTVSATVAEDIKSGAVKAVGISLVVVFMYIFIRFRRWQYGLGAIASLAFNVIAVLGIFTLLGSIEGLSFMAEVDQNFIAALLTIVGYTINDTVVVFDRIRETVGTDVDNSRLPGYFNRAINDTFSRTAVTSVTTVLSAAILFFFGGDVLKGFMLALVAGIVVGTFSSIFIASPISLDLILGRTTKKERQTAEPARV
jgi:SecD/SecF fusion protein